LANITSIGPGPAFILAEDGGFVNKIRVDGKTKSRYRQMRLDISCLIFGI
jgi:hypothetical protein